MARKGYSRNKWSKESMDSLIDEAEKAYSRYGAALKSGKSRSISYWRNKLSKMEEPVRLETNRRLAKVLKQGIGEGMGFYDKLLQHIDYQMEARDSAQRHLFTGQTAKENYENIILGAKFIRSATSTTKGVYAVLDKIKSDSPLYTKLDMEPSKFYDFWRWRQQNPVHEFFKIFPPSPPELASRAATMVIDIWNAGGEEAKMMDEYIKEFNRFLETQDSDWQEGIPPSLLFERIGKLHGSLRS